MQINNIALTANKCIKPKRLASFTGNENSASEKKKVRYKHYEELSDDVLSARSIIKAHQDVQNSGKMRLYKAIPAIATGIIATSIAITRPGKLSAKAATGLGFLATAYGADALLDAAFNPDETKRKKGAQVFGAMAAIGVGAAAIAKGAGKSEKLKSLTRFATKEMGQLTAELNKTRLADFSDKVIEPFFKKHPKLGFATPLITTAATSILGALASVGLIQGISQDISHRACENFEHAKLIQQAARAHYDSIDAQEV